VKATPRFSGHYQPTFPPIWDFITCDCRKRAAQAELALDHGVRGFCYYHYWFNGRRILERPMNDVLKSGEPDSPFCICWANENWNRTWDGLDAHLLLEQRYSAADYLAHICSPIPVFSDRRYIRVDDRPLVLVYRAPQLSEPHKQGLHTRAFVSAGRGVFVQLVEAARVVKMAIARRADRFNTRRISHIREADQ
jgi:O-antigen biosynthesis protein